MPLHLNSPKNIKTGFMVDLIKQGSVVEILSITLRLKEKTVLIEYRIPSDDGQRDHRTAVTISLADLPKNKLKAIIADVYGEIAKLPEMSGTVTDDNI